MSEQSPIKLNKHEAKVSRWLNSATEKCNRRPVLEGINVNGQAVGCDGYRIHSVDSDQVPPLTGFEGQTVKFYKTPPASGGYVETCEIEGTYPDYDQIIDGCKSNDVVVEIGVNPLFLIDALKTLDTSTPVRLTFYHSSQPFEVKGKITTNTRDQEHETEVYALIMPMHLDE